MKLLPILALVCFASATLPSAARAESAASLQSKADHACQASVDFRSEGKLVLSAYYASVCATLNVAASGQRCQENPKCKKFPNVGAGER